MLRLATYNVEWFAELFGRDGRLLEDHEWSGRHDVTRKQQIEALGIVFTALDADAVMVIEAPDGSARKAAGPALEHFAARFGLRARKALLGFINDTRQEIALLYDPDVMEARHAPRGDPTGKKGARGAPRFDGTFLWDLDVDAAPEKIRFSKPPLEALVHTQSGKRLNLIGVHAKSKAPHGAGSEKEAMRIAIDNRRKQLAQCIWIRRRVDELLAEGESVIVMGDFNDGPGLDEYERLFGRSGVEIVLGEGGAGRVPLFDPHAEMVIKRHTGPWPATARFYLKSEGRYFSALLDYIMISPDLRRDNPRWRIWHPFDDPECFANTRLREALLTASDHFPVSLDLDL